MNALSASTVMCDAAMAECAAATVVLPAALPCVWKIFEGREDAGEIDEAGAVWRETHEALGEAREELDRLVEGLGKDAWSGKDRTSYEHKVHELGQQFEDAAAFAEVAGVTLSTLAYGLFAFASFSVAVGTILAATAVEVAMADATIIGAPAAEAEGNAIALECFEALQTAGTALMAAMGVGAGVFEGGAMIDAGVETADGSSSAIPDFVQAEVSSIPDVATSLGKWYVGHKIGEATEGAGGIPAE